MRPYMRDEHGVFRTRVFHSKFERGWVFKYSKINLIFQPPAIQNVFKFLQLENKNENKILRKEE